jgi:hypothetical protein
LDDIYCKGVRMLVTSSVHRIFCWFIWSSIQVLHIKIFTHRLGIYLSFFLHLFPVNLLLVRQRVNALNFSH